MESNSISELNIWICFYLVYCIKMFPPPNIYIYIMFSSDICFGSQQNETIQYLEFLWWIYEPSCSENWRFFSHITKSVSFIILNQSSNVQCGWSVAEHGCPLQSLSCRFVHPSVSTLHPVVNLCFRDSESWTVIRALLRIVIIEQHITQGAWCWPWKDLTAQMAENGVMWWSSWN